MHRAAKKNPAQMSKLLNFVQELYHRIVHQKDGVKNTVLLMN